MGTLDGKVAIITGATSGIGEKIAEVFMEEGAEAVIAGRRVVEGTVLEKRLGVNASFIRTDVSNEADVQAMVDHAVQLFGHVDILITR
jgi:NAD(P)-dependent dehydrogenase (short-subunit alcohol dehydrogenase family)